MLYFLLGAGIALFSVLIGAIITLISISVDNHTAKLTPEEIENKEAYKRRKAVNDTVDVA